MFEVLHMVEAMLPRLVGKPETWQSKRIDYTPPLVERLYQDVNIMGVVYRVYLHRIHMCEVAYFHPHPWPSAIRVIGGVNSVYEMGIGFGAGTAEPPLAARVVVEAGMEYEMTHPDGWHYVKISGGPSLSVMVSGPPWGRATPRTAEQPFRSLVDGERDAILNTYRNMTDEKAVLSRYRNNVFGR